jgi:hypothetical protein
MADEKKEKSPRKPREPKPPKDCACGCGAQTKGGNYLPGHDSRHVSQVSAEALKVSGAARENVFKRLPTDALIAKARAKVSFEEEKAAERAKKAAPAA